MILWIKVTNDEYELPVAVADSLEELAQMCGIKKESIIQMLSRVKHHKYLKWSCYRRVEIEEDEDLSM